MSAPAHPARDTGDRAIALATRALSKSFGSLPVARDIAINLPAGARHALIGPNGAGKTTLINLMTGMLAPNAGQILLGGDDITTPSARTPDQTEIGLFWVESSPLAWNRLARAVSVDRGFDLWENARLFGLLNLAMADGYIASWEVKYHYSFWRPVTAIREGDADGNPNTQGDSTWTPLIPTYPIPDHDSGHAVQGGVAAEILKQVFGTDDVSFTACSMTVGAGMTCTDPTPVIRSYSSFSQAADENAASRIYIGIHFRKAVETGVHHGRRIAAYAVHQFMKPVR